MDDGASTSEMNDPQRLKQLIDQQFGAIYQELDGMANLVRLLMGRNTSLMTDEMNRRKRLETNLRSSFIKIKAGIAEARQMSGMTDTNGTVARAGTTEGRRGQRSIYDEIMDFLRNVSHENIVLNEKLRREGELLAEAKRDAAESAKHSQKVTSGLMAKLNSMQTRKEILYDDQCVLEWRRIQQALDHWTRQTFKDKLAMNRMTVEALQQKPLAVMPKDEYLQNVYAKRVYIQSILFGSIFETVLKSPFVSHPDTWTERVLSLLGEGVKKSGSHYDWEIWRSFTSKALENCPGFLNGRLDTSREILLGAAEATFGDFYSPNARKIDVHEELKKVFDDCLAFKKKLERQEFDYVFRQSPPGTVYSAEKMNSLNYNEKEGSTVVMSIWPSLHKVSFDNKELLIEREAVWTKDPDQADNAGMEHQSDIEKEIKQEIKTEDHDEAMSGVTLET